MTHLDHLEIRLMNESRRLNAATCPHEIEMRKVWVAGCEKEIAAEHKFMGTTPITLDDILTDDELLAELGV